MMMLLLMLKEGLGEERRGRDTRRKCADAHCLTLVPQSCTIQFHTCGVDVARERERAEQSRAEREREQSNDRRIQRNKNETVTHTELAPLLTMPLKSTCSHRRLCAYARAYASVSNRETTERERESREKRETRERERPERERDQRERETRERDQRETQRRKRGCCVYVHYLSL